MSFVTGAHDEEIGRAVVTRQRGVRQAPVETNLRIDSEGSRQAPQFRRKRPVSDNVEDSVGKLRARASECVQEQGLIFDRNERRYVEKREASLEKRWLTSSRVNHERKLSINPLNTYVLLELQSRDLIAVHLVRAIGQP